MCRRSAVFNGTAQPGKCGAQVCIRGAGRAFVDEPAGVVQILMEGDEDSAARPQVARIQEDAP